MILQGLGRPLWIIPLSSVHNFVMMCSMTATQLTCCAWLWGKKKKKMFLQHSSCVFVGLFLFNDHLINISTCQNNRTRRTGNNHVVVRSIWWQDAGIIEYSKEKNLPKQNLPSATLQDVCCKNSTAESKKAYFTSLSCLLPTLDNAANWKSFYMLANASV
jgi:hypothetical protein